MEPYIILTPVGSHKIYCIREFLDSAWSMLPPPEEIWICVDLDQNLDTSSWKARIFYSPAIEENSSELFRISMAREILRQKFVWSKYDWAFWLDSDIFCPKETPRILFEIAEKEKVLMVSNRYPGRSSGKWSGSGCMLTSKIACTASRFWVGHMGEKHISEDYIFLSIIDQASWIFQETLGRRGRVIGDFVEVRHLLKRNLGENLPKGD